MVICAVVNCHNRSDRGENIRFFRLPAIITHQGSQALQLSTERRLKWLAKINRQDLTPERYPNIRVCSRHFVSGSPAQLFDQAIPDWTPTLFLGYSTTEQVESLSSTSRYTRAKERLKRKRRHSETEKEVDVHSQAPLQAEDDHELFPEEEGIETQTEMSMQGLNNL